MARKTTDYIIIHCSATSPSHNVDIRDVDRWHRAQQFRMVGYHYFIKRDGTLQTGRPLMDGGAHATGYNEKSVGVCMAGGVASDGVTPDANFTLAQWEQLTRIITELHEQFPGAKIIGHNEVAKKDCPCFDVKKWWASVHNK